MNYLQKLKEYYKNSPRRIGWTWFFVHLFFLIIALILLSILVLTPVGYGYSFSSFWDFLRMIPSLVYLFPILFLRLLFANIPESTRFVLLSVPILYYILLIFMIIKSKNTSSLVFKVMRDLFFIWFFISLIFSFIVFFLLS